MITLQHVALYFMALADKNHLFADVEMRMKNEIPWLLLPDAIRAYTGPRQMSHFEETPDQTDVSWMEFPMGETLQLLTKETAREVIATHMNADKYPKCVIGENTDLDTFDLHNYGHPNYRTLRIHLIQDRVLDEMLRRFLVDATGRFEDHYVLRKNSDIVLNGIELRKQVSLFEEWGLLHLVGKIYHKTGVLLNQKWFDEYVDTVLHNSAYPEDLADNTYRYMRIPEEIEAKINALDFEIPEDLEIFGLRGKEELTEKWDLMYSVALRGTGDVM